MSRKKVEFVKKEEEKPKPIDRTQIIIALIGLIGTVSVAVLALLNNKTPEKPVETVEFSTTQVAGAPAANTPLISTSQVQNTVPSISQPMDGCVKEYFTNIAPENQNFLEVGADITILINSQNENTVGPFGIQFTENGAFIGALQFLGFKNTSSFKITSVVDADCTQITDFGNIDNPPKQTAINNWDSLGFHLTTGNYRLRMGLPGGNQIELNFTSN